MTSVRLILSLYVRQKFIYAELWAFESFKRVLHLKRLPALPCQRGELPLNDIWKLISIYMVVSKCREKDKKTKRERTLMIGLPKFQCYFRFCGDKIPASRIMWELSSDSSSSIMKLGSPSNTILRIWSSTLFEQVIPSKSSGKEENPWGWICPAPPRVLKGPK